MIHTVVEAITTTGGGFVGWSLFVYLSGFASGLVIACMKREPRSHGGTE